MLGGEIAVVWRAGEDKVANEKRKKWQEKFGKYNPLISNFPFPPTMPGEREGSKYFRIPKLNRRM